MKRIELYLIILLSTLIACSGIKEKGRPLSIEMPFNDGWEFVIDFENSGIQNKWNEGLPIGDKKSVTIPHTWNIMDGYEEFTGTGWYEKEFLVDNDWIGKPVYLRFGGIYRDATIWLNGRQIMDRIGSGYTPFKVRLTDYMESGKNTIVIRVNNEFSDLAIPYERKFDWTNDGGIIRDITLYKSEEPSIDYVHFTPGQKGTTGTVGVKLMLNEKDYRRISLWVRVTEENQSTKNEVFAGNFKVKVRDKVGYVDFEIENVKSWHFDQPNLYRVDLAVGFSTILTDTYTCNIGFRDFITISDKVRFNGEFVRLPGIEWMPGSNPEYGMAEPAEEMNKMLNLMREVNAVYTRFHWQQPEALFDWCDRNGLMVMEEVPLWQAPFEDQLNDSLRKIVDNQIREMVTAHYNHPSIISWGIGNEMQGQSETIKDFLSDLIDEIHELDTTRIINYVSNSMQNDIGNDATILGNWPAWNDYTGYWYLGKDGSGLGEEELKPILEKYHTIVPQKPLMISEYGLCEPDFPGGDPERIRHFNYHTDVYDGYDFIAGFIYFSLNDYRTHMGGAGEGKFRRREHGIVDLTGKKKPSFNVIKERLSPVENIEIAKNSKTISVRGTNRSGIPSYTLRGYYVEFKDQNGANLGDSINLPDLKPGDPFNAVIHYDGTKIDHILIKRPNGYVVTKSKFENSK